MTTFYIGVLALTLTALIFAVWPYIRRPKGASVDAFNQERQATNVDSFRDHVLELETQFQQGNIEQAQFEETKAELERSLLNDNSEMEDIRSAKAGKAIKLLYWVLVFIVMPIAVFYIYQMLGSKQTVLLSDKIAEKTALEQQWLASGNNELEEPLQNLRESLILDLEKHISQNPEDLDSHVLLAREAMNTGKYEKAIKTYQIIIEKEPTAAQMVAEMAQAIFVREDRRAVPIVGVLAERAVELQPDNVMAREIAGISAFQNQQFQQAIDHWERAVILRPNSSAVPALRGGIAEAKIRLNSAGEDGSVVSEQSSAAANATPVVEAAAGPSLTLAVSVGDGVDLEPNSAVFIYARAWQGAKVPLAIFRVNVSDLPLTVELDNTMSMAPGMDLSTAEQVELIARVSQSGTAIAQEGDWQATLGPVDVANSPAEPFKLVIDTQYKP